MSLRTVPVSPSCSRMARNRARAGPFPTPSREQKPSVPNWRGCVPSLRWSSCVSGPQLVETCRKNFGALPKSEHADAFLIAERIRYGRKLPSPFQLDTRYAPLQRLTRFRCHLTHNLVREKNYFLSFLFLTFASYGQLAPFGDPFGATSCAVLEEFTTEDLAQQSLDDLATYLQDKGHGRFANPQDVAASLQRAARDS